VLPRLRSWFCGLAEVIMRLPVVCSVILIPGLLATGALAQAGTAPAKPKDEASTPAKPAGDKVADDKAAGDKVADDKVADDKAAADKAAADKAAADKAAGAGAATGADATTPDLPPLPGESTAAEPATPDVEAPAAAGTQLTAEDLARLKAELKADVKAEVQAELRAQLQNELDAAARDQATAKAAALEWQEERWIEEVKPKLNFLELDGYFRFRFDLFNRLDLGTYDPINQRGTSGFPTPTYYRPFDGAECGDGTPDNFSGAPCDVAAGDTQTIISANMRLRLDPTLNVSEDIRIRSTIDVFDNLVMGSTPESLPGFAQNPTLPLPLFAASQNPPQAGLNSIYDALRIRRVWAEIMTPIGELRFGRMPQNFGLGLLANDGNRLDQDFGDNADQVVFGTRIAGHIIAPGYSWSSSGPFGRGGGAGAGGDLDQGFFQNEQGQRFNLDPADDVHSFLLVIAKKDSEDDIKEQLRQGNVVLNYGIFGVYRTQTFDIPSYYGPQQVLANPPVGPEQYIVRGANAGIGSLWGRFQWDKLKIEAEFVGIIGQADGTATTSGGLDDNDSALQTIVDGEVFNNPLFILQGGFALETSYAFLNDSLVVGVDAGAASGDDAFGFGNRPVINQNPQAGDLDGKQYGECLERGDVAVDGVDCVRVDNDVTNFRFDSDYIVDMILWREILGTVTDAFYVKPHIAYYFTPGLGLRADVIYSQAIFASSTPGLQNPLGVELDVKGFYANEDGVYIMPQAGILLPLGGLNHFEDTQLSDERFRTAQFAWTFQMFAGIQF